MNDRQLRMFNKAFSKQAFMPLTDQAMAAQGAPMPPQGGAPMPPPQAGAPMPPVDPNTGMPMDPSMAGGAPMPPQGGMPPVDPATGMPIDPNTGMPIDPNAMAGGMPPQGAPMPPQGAGPVSTGDMVIDMLLEMGAMIVDPNGQPVPPEMIAQLVQEMNAQTGGMPPQGGAPQDPNGDAVLETMAQLDKNVSVMLDKLDSIRAIVDDLRGPGDNIEGKSPEGGKSNEIDPELLAFLEEQAMANQQSAVPEQAPVEPLNAGGIPIDPQQAQQLGLMQAMQAGQY